MSRFTLIAIPAVIALMGLVLTDRAAAAAVDEIGLW